MGHLYDAIVESKRIDEQESKPARYSDGKDGTWWYFTTHGVQPGSVPKDLHVVDTIETSNGTYVGLDGVLNTSELKKYDMKEKTPPKDIVQESCEDCIEDKPIKESKLNEDKLVDIEQYITLPSKAYNENLEEDLQVQEEMSDSDFDIYSKEF